MSVRTWIRRGAALAAAWLMAAGIAWAQAGTASLRGTVTDEQGGALPGATVTATSAATSAARSTVTDGSGGYQFLALAPGLYDVKYELNGFRTAVRQQVALTVDSASKLDIVMQIGALSEVVTVNADVTHINTTDASIGNTISGEQVRNLPLEANNVVGLLSLQPGAVYVPNAAVTDSRTGAVLSIDPRSGAVSGGRADQSNVTLDGIDVNDPQFGTAYSSAVRVTLDSLSEFRVSTSNYGADTGRSSGAQVSLVTRSGSNDWHGSANWVQRNTRFSSNDYFLKLSQLQAGEAERGAKARQEDLWRVLRRAGEEGQAVLLRQLRTPDGRQRNAAPAQRAVAVDARRRADLSVRRSRSVSGRQRAGLQRFASGRGRVLRVGALAAGNARSAGHRPEPARVGLLQDVSHAERPRHRRRQPRGLSLRRADQQRVQHLHRPRGLPALEQPDLLRPLQRAGRLGPERARVPRGGVEHRSASEEPRPRHGLGRRALLVDDQHLPLRRDADPRRHRGPRARRPGGLPQHRSDPVADGRPRRATSRHTPSWTTCRG